MNYATLEECCTILDHQRIPIKKSERTEGIIPYYGANGLQGYINDYIFDDDLVLLAEDGGAFGSATTPIAYRVSGKCWVNNHAHVLKPMNNINVDYLCYALMFYPVNSLITGTTRKKLTQSAMRKICIPLRSLSEQIQIVCLLKKVEQTINECEQLQKDLDILVKSQFVEMFGDPMTNPMGWDVLSWQDLFATTTGKLDANASVVGGRYPFFTCAKEPFAIDEYAFNCEALLLAGNNAAGVYDVKYYKGRFNAYQRTYVLQLKNSAWQYKIFRHQLEERLVYLQSQSIGTNTKYLTLGILHRLNFIVPHLALQNEFAAFVEQVDKSKLVSQILAKI